MILDIDSCASALAPFLREHPEVMGPHETDYGVGFMPTISYWCSRRRVHLYEDLDEVFAIEVADRESGIAQRCHIETTSAAREIMAGFLCGQCAVADLPSHDWIRDGADHDKFIPDPPNQHTPANFASWTGGHTVSAAVPSQNQRERKWWQIWR
jgi:hypothetical protein